MMVHGESFPCQLGAGMSVMRAKAAKRPNVPSGPRYARGETSVADHRK